jgi:type IV secretory pathway component VirB8
MVEQADKVLHVDQKRCSVLFISLSIVTVIANCGYFSIAPFMPLEWEKKGL